MYINKRLLSAFMATGLVAGFALAQSNDRYLLDSGKHDFNAYNVGDGIGDQIGAGSLSTELTDENPGAVPIDYFIANSSGERMDVSTIIDGDSEGNVLKLNTDGDIIDFKVTDDAGALSSPNEAISIPIGKEIYIDTRMQFVASEDPPGPEETEGADAKIALWVNADTNLVVRHGKPNIIPNGSNWYYPNITIVDTVVSNSGTAVAIVPDTWYNVKILLRNEVFTAGGVQQAFQVYIDEALVDSEDNAVGDSWALELDDASEGDAETHPTIGGTWFLSCLNYNDAVTGNDTVEILDSLSFKGTGAIASISLYTEPPVMFTITPVATDGSIQFSPSIGGGVEADTLLTATAVPDPGYDFTGWEVFVTGDAGTTIGYSTIDSTSISFTVTTNITVVANFTQGSDTPYTVDVIVIGGGLISLNNGGWVSSANDLVSAVTVEQQANPDYEFAYWYVKVGNAAWFTSTETSFTTTLTDDTIIKAYFTSTGGGQGGEFYPPLITKIEMFTDVTDPMVPVEMVRILVVEDKDPSDPALDTPAYVLRSAATLDGFDAIPVVNIAPVDDTAGVWTFEVEKVGDVQFYRAYLLDAGSDPVGFDFSGASAPQGPVFSPAGFEQNQAAIVSAEPVSTGDNAYAIVIKADPNALASFNGFGQGNHQYVCVLLKFSDTLVGKKFVITTTELGEIGNGTFDTSVGGVNGPNKLDPEFGDYALLMTVKADIEGYEKELLLTDPATSETWTFTISFQDVSE